LLGAAALQTPMLRTNNQVKVLIGAIVTVLVVYTYIRRARQAKLGEAAPEPKHTWYAIWGTGLLAGFLTMVANAAGPVTTLYLLATQLPKMEFIGTGAWLFFIFNMFKVPFSVALHLITPSSLVMDLELAPAVIIGAFSGKWLVSFVNQKLFEELALFFALLSGLNMLFSPLFGHH